MLVNINENHSTVSAQFRSTLTCLFFLTSRTIWHDKFNNIRTCTCVLKHNRWLYLSFVFLFHFKYRFRLLWLVKKHYTPVRPSAFSLKVSIRTFSHSTEGSFVPTISRDSAELQMKMWRQVSLLSLNRSLQRECFEFSNENPLEIIWQTRLELWCNKWLWRNVPWETFVVRQ